VTVSGPILGIGLFEVFWLLVVVAINVGVLVLIVLGIRWLIQRNDRNREIADGASRPGGPADPALLALRERFARGEIDAEEFEQRRRVLGG
jgi:putative membrane protein